MTGQPTRAVPGLEGLEERKLLAFTANFNFQPSSARVPSGYVADTGKAYGARNGLTYGWNTSVQAMAYDRNSSRSPDQRYDTLIQMQNKGLNFTWELAVPSGGYRVRVVLGDPLAYDSVYGVTVEGVLATEGTPDSHNRWIEGSPTVAVKDGKLTIANAAGSYKNKIAFVEITQAWVDTPTDPTTPPPTDPTPPTPAGPSIGVNLDSVTDFSTIGAFTDLATTFRPWGQPSTYWLPDNSIPLTADNYPLADAGTMTYARSYPDGKYQVSYDGVGSLKFAMAPGTTYTVTSHVGDHWTGVLTLVHGSADNILSMTVTGTSASNPIRNLHVISPDANASVSDTFRPVFLQKIAPFNGVIRTMDWTQTNDSTIANWSDRATPARFSYTGANGVPWEQIVKLANTAKKDLWVNVPAGATDAYVHSLAVLIRDTLDPSLHVYVEYSNEVWNTMFAQAAANRDAATADASLTATDTFGRQAQEAGKQIVRLSNLFRADFGDSAFASRVRMELGGFAANAYWSQTALDFIKSKYGAPSTYLSGVAIAPYVGDPGMLGEVDAAGVTADALFNWMNNFVDTSIASWVKGHKAIADQYGLRLEAYEGGQSLTATNGLNEALKQSMQDDPRMGDLLKKLVNTWVANGGGTFTHYALATPPSKFGYWGPLTSIDQVTSVKYAALLSLLPATTTLPATLAPTSSGPLLGGGAALAARVWDSAI